MSKLTAAALLSMLVFAPAVLAGPFGLEMGMTLSQVGGAPEKLTNGKYKLKSVPKPHSAFEAYMVQIGPSTGLCFAKGIGKNINTSVYGAQVKTEFSSLKEKLVATYGKPTTDIDQLLPGSIWNEPNDWMMGLLKKERILGVLWEREKGAVLPSNLDTVGLIATASGTDSAYLNLEYSFTNEDACEAELAKEEDSAL